MFQVAPFLLIVNGLIVTAILTIEHSSAVLRCGRQRQAGVVKPVAIVANADFKLDGVIHILKEGGRVKSSEQRILSLPHEFLHGKPNRRSIMFV